MSLYRLLFSFLGFLGVTHSTLAGEYLEELEFANLLPEPSFNYYDAEMVDKDGNRSNFTVLRLRYKGECHWLTSAHAVLPDFQELKLYRSEEPQFSDLDLSLGAAKVPFPGNLKLRYLDDNKECAILQASKNLEEQVACPPYETKRKSIEEMSKNQSTNYYVFGRGNGESSVETKFAYWVDSFDVMTLSNKILSSGYDGAPELLVVPVPSHPGDSGGAVTDEHLNLMGMPSLSFSRSQQTAILPVDKLLDCIDEQQEGKFIINDELRRYWGWLKGQSKSETISSSTGYGTPPSTGYGSPPSSELMANNVFKYYTLADCFGAESTNPIFKIDDREEAIGYIVDEAGKIIHAARCSEWEGQWLKLSNLADKKLYHQLACKPVIVTESEITKSLLSDTQIADLLSQIVGGNRKKVSYEIGNFSDYTQISSFEINGDQLQAIKSELSFSSLEVDLEKRIVKVESSNDDVYKFSFNPDGTKIKASATKIESSLDCIQAGALALLCYDNIQDPTIYFSLAKENHRKDPNVSRVYFQVAEFNREENILVSKMGSLQDKSTVTNILPVPRTDALIRRALERREY